MDLRGENSNPFPLPNSQLIDQVIQDEKSNPFPLNQSQKQHLKELEQQEQQQNDNVQVNQNIQDNQDNLENQDNQRQSQKGKDVKFLFLGNKAGMENIDKQKIQKTIYEASKDSEYFKKQQQKREKYKQKIEEMKYQIQITSKNKKQMEKIKEEVDKKVIEFESQRIDNRVWVHFDIDMFFIACEIRDNPSLKDKPCAVGGQSMLSTANYVARKYGVRAAMPGFIAKKLCPDLILIEHHGEKYRTASKQFKDVLSRYDPEFESMGGDEANLDITNYLREHNILQKEEILQLCHDIRKEIYDITKLTVSCSIAPNKMLAKLGSDMNKPNGQFYIPSEKEQIIEFMQSLPSRKIPGIGSVCEQILEGLEITTCKDIYDNRYNLRIVFTDSSYDFFLKSSLGIARSYHELQEDRKSISVSRTFRPIKTEKDILDKTFELSEMLSQDLKAYDKLGQHIQMTFKTIQFNVTNKSQPLDKYTDCKEVIYKACKKVVLSNFPKDPLRLLGIRMANLIDKDEYKKQSIEKYFLKKDNTGSNNQNSSTNKNNNSNSFKNKFLQQQQPQQNNQDSKSNLSRTSSSSSLDSLQQQNLYIDQNQINHEKQNITLQKTSKMKQSLQSIDEKLELQQQNNRTSKKHLSSITQEDDIDIDAILIQEEQKQQEIQQVDQNQFQMQNLQINSEISLDLQNSIDQLQEQQQNQNIENPNVQNNTNQINSNQTDQVQSNDTNNTKFNNIDINFNQQFQNKNNGFEIQQQNPINSNIQQFQDENNNNSISQQEHEQTINQLQQNPPIQENNPQQNTDQEQQQFQQENQEQQQDQGFQIQEQQLQQQDENSIMMEDIIPRIFTCFICNKEIDCMANVTRMNNHINNCLEIKEKGKKKQSSGFFQNNSTTTNNTNKYPQQQKRNITNNNNKQTQKKKQVNNNNNEKKSKNPFQLNQSQSNLQSFFKKQ